MAATNRPRRKLCGQCAQSFFQHRALRWGWWLFWGVIWFCWGARALRAANEPHLPAAQRHLPPRGQSRGVS